MQPPVAPAGGFTKDAFHVDLPAGEVSCPAGRTAPLRPAGEGRVAWFGAACASCQLAAQCTTAKDGRSVYAGPYEEQLARARARQRDPDWTAGYRATLPKVERKAVDAGSTVLPGHGQPVLEWPSQAADLPPERPVVKADRTPRVVYWDFEMVTCRPGKPAPSSSPPCSRGRRC